MPRSQKLDINLSFSFIFYFVLFLAVLGLGCGTESSCVMLDLCFVAHELRSSCDVGAPGHGLAFLWRSDLVGPWHVESYFLEVGIEPVSPALEGDSSNAIQPLQH